MYDGDQKLHGADDEYEPKFDQVEGNQAFVYDFSVHWDPHAFTFGQRNADDRRNAGDDAKREATGEKITLFIDDAVRAGRQETKETRHEEWHSAVAAAAVNIVPIDGPAEDTEAEAKGPEG